MAGEYNKRTALPAATDTVIAQAPAEKGLRCHVNLLNRGNVPRRARLYLDTAATPEDADYLEYEAVLLPGVPLVRGPLVLRAGEKLYARVDGANCNAVAMGEEAWTA